MLTILTRLKKLFNSPESRIHLEAETKFFYDLISEDAVIECVATGFHFTEGPVWFAEDKYLLFSDIPADKILRLTPDGRVSTYRKPSNNSNGLTRDREGRLIVCEHGSRRVTRTEKDGSLTILADKFEEMKLNSPNDVVVKSDGAIYFTDPPYGIQPEQQEQPVKGVYRLSADQSKLTLLVDDFTAPNGLAFSPDGSSLYIDDSERRHIRVFDVQSTGSLSGGQVFHDMDIDKPGAPDGMKVDESGNIYCTGPGGVWVLDPEGRHLGTIVAPEPPANCAWGDDDWQSLYITAQTSIYKVRTNIPGIATGLRQN
jgi:gluconolactonase